MTCGIYAIVNKVNRKVYVGKSINIEKRFNNHLRMLRKETKHKDCNRLLFSSFKKYGESNFEFIILEELERNEELLKIREYWWMTWLSTTDRRFGYNLRLDSETKCIVSDETKVLISKLNSGESNPNFGNRWTDEQKKRNSDIATENHRNGKYSSEETRRKHSESSKKFWEENPEKKEQMRVKVSEVNTVFKIEQYSKDGLLIRVWDSMREILIANPDYFRIAIYNCCNGYKKSYRGFLWKKLSKI